MDRVAIRRRGGDVLRGDVAAGACAVLDHDRLPDVLGELLGDDPGRGIGAAAGREADGQGDRTIGKSLGERTGRKGNERGARPRDARHGHSVAQVVAPCDIRAVDFSRHYDLLVVGGGNAALCAAITARARGVSVLIVESAPIHFRGGNSRHTRNMRTMHDGPLGVLTGAYPEAEYWEDLVKVTGGLTDETLARLTIRGTQDARAVDEAARRTLPARRSAARCSCRGRTRSSSEAARRS